MSCKDRAEGLGAKETPQPSLRGATVRHRVSRIALVAAIWAVLGAPAGGMLTLLARPANGPVVGFIVGSFIGTVVGAILGGLLEAVYG
jgi:hypothetical protein